MTFPLELTVNHEYRHKSTVRTVVGAVSPLVGSAAVFSTNIDESLACCFAVLGPVIGGALGLSLAYSFTDPSKREKAYTNKQLELHNKGAPSFELQYENHQLRVFIDEPMHVAIASNSPAIKRASISYAETLTFSLVTPYNEQLVQPLENIARKHDVVSHITSRKSIQAAIHVPSTQDIQRLSAAASAYVAEAQKAYQAAHL